MLLPPGVHHGDRDAAAGDSAAVGEVGVAAQRDVRGHVEVPVVDRRRERSRRGGVDRLLDGDALEHLVEARVAGVDQTLDGGVRRVEVGRLLLDAALLHRRTLFSDDRGGERVLEHLAAAGDVDRELGCLEDLEAGVGEQARCPLGRSRVRDEGADVGRVDLFAGLEQRQAGDRARRGDREDALGIDRTAARASRRPHRLRGSRRGLLGGGLLRGRLARLALLRRCPRHVQPPQVCAARADVPSSQLWTDCVFCEK